MAKKLPTSDAVMLNAATVKAFRKFFSPLKVGASAAMIHAST